MAQTKGTQPQKPLCPERWSCTVCNSSDLVVYKVFKYMADHLNDPKFVERWKRLDELWLDA